MGFSKSKALEAVRGGLSTVEALDALLAEGAADEGAKPVAKGSGEGSRNRDRDGHPRGGERAARKSKGGGDQAVQPVDGGAAVPITGTSAASSSSSSLKRPREAVAAEAAAQGGSLSGATRAEGSAAAASASSAKRPQANESHSTAARNGGAPPRRSETFLPVSDAPRNCSICLDTQDAWCAFRLPCGCGWYCAACIGRHAEARLDVGKHDVTCPECYKEVGEAMLKAILPQKTLERLHQRSLEGAVSAANNIWPCPTPDCPIRVAIEPGDEPCLRCTHCNKEHCLLCQASPYHTGLTCDEHASKRRRLKNDKDSEDLFHEWMKKTGSKQCPKCKMAITKQDLGKQGGQKSECHKMICRNCNVKFCFKCLTVLSSSRSCGCTPETHGFIDPRTGAFVAHNLKKRR